MHDSGNGVLYDMETRRISLSLGNSTLTTQQAVDLAKSLTAASNAIKASLALISRKKAKDAELTRFFTGIPCIHEHISQRMVSNGACVMCLRMWETNTEEKQEKRNKAKRRRARTARQKRTPEQRTEHNKKERLRESQKISRTIRNRMGIAVKSCIRSGSAVRDLGCSREKSDRMTAEAALRITALSPCQRPSHAPTTKDLTCITEDAKVPFQFVEKVG